MPLARCSRLPSTLSARAHTQPENHLRPHRPADRVIAWYQAHQDAIFQKGFTRQIAENEGWQRIIGKTPVSHYTNGGAGWWAPVSSCPPVAHGDIELARMLLRDLAANIEQQRLCESINAAGAGEGASGFLMAMAMPALAIECVLKGKSWPGCC